MKKIARKMSTPTVKMRMIWTPAEGLVIEHGDDDDDDDDDNNDVDDGDYAESSGRLDGQPSDWRRTGSRLFLLCISNFITSKDGLKENKILNFITSKDDLKENKI